MNIPTPPDVLTGTDWTLRLQKYEGAAREAVLLRAYVQGYVPPFLRTPVDIFTHIDGSFAATLSVLPDYLCLGTDEDYLRTPMWPGTAQQIADAWGCVLPTRHMVNAAWEQAGVRLTPLQMPFNDPLRPMTGTRMFVDHNTRIAGQLGEYGPPGKLVAGHKKDIVLSPRLGAGHVAIYGWHQLSGGIIQPLNCVSHSSEYCDYSHGVRLFDATMTLEDGSEVTYADLLKDASRWGLLSDEGPSLVWRQPGV